MSLRPQQYELHTTVNEIISGKSNVKDIFLFWAPGGGKSLAPVVLSDMLINNRKQIWVVPRDALKFQGESDYQNEYYPVDKVARVADNSGDPFRGCDACLTTYQAIGANPEKWIEVCRKYNIMLILDEFHHLSNHGDWIKSISEMKKLSFLSVFMTGTITRGDDTKIPFVPYVGNSVNFSNTETTKWICYSREQALKDGSILPFEAILINGSGKYIDKEGFERGFKKFSDSGDELRCAFKTDYAYHLLDMAVSHWRSFRIEKEFAKMLIVSPDIETAKEYLLYLKRYFAIRAGIATSDDNKSCKGNVKKFKQPNTQYGSLNCLVTVGIAYEGLSVPAITHMAVLTLIRSIPWLEQCTARPGRNHPGKEIGYIFAPEDPRMLTALKSITKMIIHAATGEPPEPRAALDPDNPNGGTARTIEALESEAHIDGIPIAGEFAGIEQKRESQSEKEKRLREEINKVINRIVGISNAGNRKVKERIFWLRVKQIVNNGRDEAGKLLKKPLKEFTVPELQLVADFSKNYK